MIVFLMVVNTVHSQCNPSCNSTWINNTVCNLECMNEACGFDGGDCDWRCSLTSCSKNASDGICDTDCDTNVCGFDFGDCGFCGRGCNSSKLQNSVCDQECNSFECQFDNYKCVSFIQGYCSKTCTYSMYSNGGCDPLCNSFECDWDKWKCSRNDCDPGCTDSRKVGDGSCNSYCNKSACSYDGGDCDCSPGCSPNMLLNGVCDTLCNNSKCYYDYQDCYCAPGCSPSMLLNDICDDACNKTECYFDMGMCICPLNCTDDLLANNVCDSECNFSSCDYDNGTCTCAPGCLPEYIGDKTCQPECKNENCTYDSGDCDCNLGCNYTMQFDSKCDVACNTSSCNYDNESCYCSPGCKPSMIHDNVCDPLCNNKQCFYDGGDCNCMPGCFPDMLGNGVCDPMCKFSNCSYDVPDCYCAPGCSSEKLANNVCDSECNNADCKLDNHKCGDCASGCFNASIDNNVCEPACKVFDCDYDYNDCADIFYYWPNQCEFAVGNYALIQPTDCNKYFIFAKDSFNARIYMVGGNFTFNNQDFNLFMYLKARILIIEPWYCADGLARGCYDAGVKPLFQIAIPMYMKINSNVQLKNLMFSSFQTNSAYSSYSYCRYVEEQGYLFIDDRNEIITDFIDGSICEISSNTNFMHMTGSSKLVLTGIVFTDMRFKYNSIIYIEKGNAILKDVDFYNIVTQNKSYVIKIADSTCNLKAFDVQFSYNGGKIMFVNNGYEVIDKNPLAGFLSLCNMKSVILTNLNFSMNLFSGPNSQVMKIYDFFEFSLENIQFEYTYSNSELILLDQSSISSIVNVDPTFLNSKHIKFQNVDFKNNVAKTMVSIKYVSECHNILFTQILFDNNEVKFSLISYNLTTLDPICIYGGSIENIENIKYPKSNRIFEISESEFLFNYAQKLISIENAGILKITNILLKSNMNSSILIGATIVSTMQKNSGYMQKSQVSVADSCINLLNIIRGFFVNISTSKFISNFCVLSDFFKTNKQFEFKSNEISSNEVYSDDHLIYMEVEDDGNYTVINGDSDYVFSDLSFSKNILSNSSKGILSFPKLLFNKITLLNIDFESCDSAIFADQIKSLSIENVIIYSSVSLTTAFLDFNPVTNSTLIITSCTCESSQSQLIEITGTGLTKITIKMEKSFFKFNKGPYLVLVDNRIVFSNESFISENSFEENEGLILKISSLGPLLVQNCKFYKNFHQGVSILEADGDILLSFLGNDLISNKGESLISVTSFKNSSKIEASSNTFKENQGSSLRISNILYTDNNSSFISNNHTSGSVIYSSTQSVVVVKDSTVVNNSVIGNGVISNILNSEIYLFNLQFKGNSAKGKGGVLFNDQNSTYLITDSLFTKNSAYQGSCIYSHYSYTENIIKNSEFNLNSATTNAAISLLESYLSTFSSKFNSNRGGAFSGFELSYYSKITLKDCSFNNKDGFGGSIIAESKSVAKLFNCSFAESSTDNIFSFFGIYSSELLCQDCIVKQGFANKSSSIYCDNSICSFTKSSFDSFQHSEDGAVFEVENSSLILTRCSIKNSTGSAIFLGRKASLLISNSEILSTFYLDSIARYGAGIKCVDCKYFAAFFTKFQFLESLSYGGAIFSSTTKDLPIGNLRNSSFLNCSAQSGGAISSFNSNYTISGCEFFNNSANIGEEKEAGKGGAIYLESSSIFSVTSVNFTEFVNNSASISGGAIQWYDRKPLLNGVKFDNNSAYYGPNLASFPDHLTVASSGRHLKDFTFAPGQLSTYPILLNSIDHHKQIVLTDNSSSIEIIVNDTKTFSISSNPKQFSISGTFNFSEIIIKGPPETNLTLIFSSDYSLARGSSSVVFKLLATLRNCITGETLVGNDSCFECPKGKYNLKPRTPCKKCPKGAICYGGSNIVSAAGYWRNDNKSDVFYECPNPAACLEEKLGEFYEKCAEGYHGKLCQSCEAGYSRSKENECAPCMNQDKNIMILSLLSVVAVVVVIGLTASNINGAYKEQSITSIYFKILTNHSQIIALTITFNLDWPKMVVDMFKVQNQGTGGPERLFSLDCFLADQMEPYYAKLIMLNTIPVACFVMSVLFWAIKALCKPCENVKSKIIGSIIVQLFFFQPSIMKMNFSMFSCYKISDGNYYMTGDMSIQCWKGDHLFYGLVIGLPGIVIWCILIPIVLALILLKSKPKLDMIQKKLKYGFLYKGYENDHFYWEFFILFRKVGIISCSVFLRNISVHIQALSVFFIILLTLIVQIKVKPYTYNHLNNMDSWSMVVSAVTIYSGLYFMTKELNSNYQLMFFCFMVLSNFIFAVYWIYYTFGFYIAKCLLKINCCKKILTSGDKKWLQRIVPDYDTTVENKETLDVSSGNKKSSCSNVSSPSALDNFTADQTMDMNPSPEIITKPKSSKLKLQWVRKIDDN